MPFTGRCVLPARARTRLSFLVLALALLTAALAPAARADDRPFSPTGVWNTPLSSAAVLDANSAGLSAELLRQRTTYGLWINTRSYSAPVYQVPAGAPTQSVYLDTPSAMYTNATDAANLRSQLSAVPIPANAVHAAGSDRHMVIWQKSTDTMWELWLAYKVPDEVTPWGTNNIPGWHAAWGARIDHVSQNPGINSKPFGATASGLPLMGGMITLADLQKGSIDHALSMALPNTAAGTYAWPANRTDGAWTGVNAIPEGTRFRLNPALDLSKVTLSPMARMIAKAMQTYGVIVRDRSSSVVLYGEDPTPTMLLGNPNPYVAAYGGLSSDAILAQIPWASLQAVSAVQPAPAASTTTTTTSTTTTSTGGTTTTTTAPRKLRRTSTTARTASRRKACRSRKAKAHRRSRCTHRVRRHR
ncbi:MAG: hypothetical protein ACJ76V_07435 [Thermoleophilaceae bacterium]